MISSHDNDIKKISKEIYIFYLTKVLSSQANLFEEGVNFLVANI